MTPYPNGTRIIVTKSPPEDDQQDAYWTHWPVGTLARIRAATKCMSGNNVRYDCTADSPVNDQRSQYLLHTQILPAHIQP